MYLICKLCYQAVFEIKLLFCALAGCTSHKTVHPEIAPCTLRIYSNNKWPTKRAHTECTPPKIVHPAMEMCALSGNGDNRSYIKVKTESHGK